MPVLRVLGVEVRPLQSVQTKAYLAREPYRQAIAELVADQTLEVGPDNTESVRALKNKIRRAANEVDRSVIYADTDQGTLLVWLAEPKPETGRRQGRPTKSREILPNDGTTRRRGRPPKSIET